jgi:hypothetical protein
MAWRGQVRTDQLGTDIGPKGGTKTTHSTASKAAKPQASKAGATISPSQRPGLGRGGGT